MPAPRCLEGCACGKHPKVSIEERFWSHVDKSGDCWLWTSACGPKGYGSFSTPRGTVSAHKFSYELEFGPIPKGLEVDHRYTCPKKCVRQSHLRLATRKQNMENRARAQVISESGIRGVSWDRNAKKWYVRVGHNNRRHYGGHHTNLASAEAAAIALRNELFTHNDRDRS